MQVDKFATSPIAYLDLLPLERLTMSQHVLVLLACAVCTLVWAWYVQQRGMSAVPVTSLAAVLAPGQPPAPSKYKHYYIATSTIPGAGLGLFAKTDLPAGKVNYDISYYEVFEQRETTLTLCCCRMLGVSTCAFSHDGTLQCVQHQK